MFTQHKRSDAPEFTSKLALVFGGVVHFPRVMHAGVGFPKKLKGDAAF